MDIVQTILVTLATLGVLVTIHEFGHFWVARRCGVRVLRFSVGFGQPLWRRRGRDGTEYVIAAIPLGGYVKMLDEREGDVPPELLGESFNRKPVQQRLAIVAAGPLANFLLAILVYWLLFMGGVTGVAPLIGEVTPRSLAETAGLEAGQEIIAVDGRPTPTREALHRRLMQRIGESGPLRLSVKYANSDIVYESTVELERWLAGDEAPDVVRGLGVELWYPPVEAVVAEVVADSPAARAGLQPGDRVVAVDDVQIDGWAQWVEYVRARPGQQLDLRLVRAGVERQLTLVPARKIDDAGVAYGQVGVAVQPPQWPEQMLREFSYSPLGALLEAGRRTGEMSLFFLESVKKMVLGEMSPKNLSGPVTIAKVASASASAGWEAYVGVLALLSISLGVLNLLPIPVLDGGHILYGLAEWIRGRPLSERVQLLGYQVGLFIIVGVMLLALYNDLMRL